MLLAWPCSSGMPCRSPPEGAPVDPLLPLKSPSGGDLLLNPPQCLLARCLPKRGPPCQTSHCPLGLWNGKGPTSHGSLTLSSCVMPNCCLGGRPHMQYLNQHALLFQTPGSQGQRGPANGCVPCRVVAKYAAPNWTARDTFRRTTTPSGPLPSVPV